MKDLASPPRQPDFTWLRFLLCGLVIAGIAWYAFYLVRYIAPYAGGSDSSGYFNNARLLSEGRFYTEPRLLQGETPGVFGEFSNVPLGFTLRKDGHMAPTYPTGYPLQLIVAACFGWDNAATILNLVTALVSGLFLYAYSRKLDVNVGIALGGVALLWLCPLFLFSAVQPMSDLSALGWSLAVLYWALLARDKWQYSLFSGVALGIAILVRPTNALLAIPVLVALGLRPRLWFATGLACLPGVAFFCFYNWRVYGHPLMTGYGAVSSAFSVDFFRHNLTHFAHWIPLLLSPLALLAFIAPFTNAGRQRGLLVLATWAVILIGFYTFYYHSGETWWYLRFILPAFPFFIVAALTVLETICRLGKSRPLITATALAAVLISSGRWEQKQILPLDVPYIKSNERSYPDAAHWAKEHLPKNSVIFCMQVSGAFFYYTDFILLRWEQILPVNYGPVLEMVAREKRPVYAALYAFELPDALERVGGQWTKISTVGQVSFWQRQP
jgi:Dolichyl-phosphate-mannose-protein mannosyltransferase